MDASEVKWCLQELIEMETSAARAHYAVYNRKTKSYDFTDEMWKRGHAYSFEVVERARKVLSELSE